MVIILGIGAMFMNKAETAHIICGVAACCLLAAGAYKVCGVYTAVYVTAALLMASVERVENTSLMLMIVSLSYFVQKLIVLLMMGSFFARMTSIPYALAAMQRLRVPDTAAVPVLVALRFFPTLREDYRNLKNSLRIRRISVSLPQFIIHPVRMVEYLLVPILMKSVRVSDELAASALLRGFEHMREQTILYPLKLKTADYIVGSMITLVVATLFYLQFK